MTREVTDAVVPWSGRGSRYTEEEIAFITEAMREADPLTQGRYKARFEEAFRAYVGSRHAFAMSSCTAALEMAAVLSRVGPGDEVIVPTHTFAATAIPFGRTGARLVWADIDPRTLVVTAETVARVLSPRTRVIVVVHLYGLMVDLDPIMDLARERNILVVEDAAQALGATDARGRRAGSVGDFGCFSFHTHKSMTTLGEGGMLTLRDDRLAGLVSGLHHNGMRGYVGERERYWLPAMSDVDFDLEGVWPYNFCLGEVQCAAGLIQLERVEAMNRERRARAARMGEAMTDFPELRFQETPEGFTNVHYCLPARYAGNRDVFMERMAFHHRVKMVVQYRPLHLYPLFQRAGFGGAACPEAERFFSSMVSFPFHQWMPDDQFEAMVAAAMETCRMVR